MRPHPLHAKGWASRSEALMPLCVTLLLPSENHGKQVLHHLLCRTSPESRDGQSLDPPRPPGTTAWRSGFRCSTSPPGGFDAWLATASQACHRLSLPASLHHCLTQATLIMSLNPAANMKLLQTPSKSPVLPFIQSKASCPTPPFQALGGWAPFQLLL